MVYKATRVKPFSTDFELVKQLRRAAVSVMANVAEGFGRRTRKEFIRFLDIASGSVVEVQSHLYVALDEHYLDQEVFRSIYAQAEKANNFINGFIAYLVKHGERNTSTPAHQHTVTLVK